MTCSGSTGLITNGSGGYANGSNQMASMMQSTGFISTGSFPQQGLPPTQSQAAVSPFISTPVSISDINNATNSFTDGGGNPVLANPNLPSVTLDQCNAIKCNINLNADVNTKIACSQSFGAGNWDPCSSQCAPYRPANYPCGGGGNPQTPQTLATQFPSQPLTPQTLVTPFPDITANQNWGVAPPMRSTCNTQWISDNPLLALAALGAVFFALGGLK